jgi:multiple sugar transport system substrate-binding protein
MVGSMALSLVGCSGGGSGSGDASGAKTLEVWDMQQSSKDINKSYAPLVKKFEAENPGTKVKVSAFPFEQYRDKVLVAMKGGTGPDVLALDQVWMAEFAAGGLIAPLNDQLASSATVKKADFFEGAWASNEYQGKNWGVPLNADVWEQMYYNADLFRAAGLDPDKPPTTWDEWNQAAGKLKQGSDQFGISLIGCKGEPAVVMTDSLVFSNGGKIVDGDKAAFNSPENIAALTQYKNLVSNAPSGTSGTCEQDAVGRFTSGKAAMLLGGSWQQDTMKDAAKFDWRIAVPPAPEGKKFVGALGGFNLAVNAKTKNPDAAFKWIEFMAKPDNQTAVSSLIPANKAAGTAFVKANRKQPEVVLETLTSGSPRPLSPVYPAISQAQQDALQAIIGGEPVENAAKKANDAIEEALKELK